MKITSHSFGFPRGRVVGAYAIARRKGKKDVVKQVPQVIGMSGTDPVGEFIISGIGLNGVGVLAKTGLWNIAKYAPKIWLGDYGR